MLMMLEFGYDFAPTREQYATLRTFVPSLPEWTEKEKDVPWGVRHGDHLIDMELAYPVLADIGNGVKVKAFKNNLLLSINERFKDLARKMLLVEAKIQHNGQLLQVHVPNNKLIEFNEVEVWEDICTNELQRGLDEGWRIIAVCPPLEARRPTYILGRHNPEHDK